MGELQKILYGCRYSHFGNNHRQNEALPIVPEKMASRPLLPPVLRTGDHPAETFPTARNTVRGIATGGTAAQTRPGR
jgi:hypothetical protein